MRWTRFKTLVFDIDDEVYEADVEVSMYRDSNYGADADGNRGIEVDIIDDVVIVEVYNQTKREEVEVSDEIKRIVMDSIENEDLDIEGRYDDM